MRMKHDFMINKSIRNKYRTANLHVKAYMVTEYDIHSGLVCICTTT